MILHFRTYCTYIECYSQWKNQFILGSERPREMPLGTNIIITLKNIKMQMKFENRIFTQ